jgi:hypothetical protein
MGIALVLLATWLPMQYYFTPLTSNRWPASRRSSVTILAQYWKASHQQALDRIAQRNQEIDRLKGEVRGLRQQLFGRKTEKGGAAQALPGLEKASSGRRRGRQPGQAGHGRRDHSHLSAEITRVDLSTDEQDCPHCHLSYAELPGAEDSETIVFDVRAYRRVILRKRYVRT